MFQSFSPKLLQAVAFAQEEALALGSLTVAPKHLLLGVIRLSEDHAADILRGRGVTLPTAVRELSSDGEPISKQELPFSDESKNVLRIAYEQSQHFQKDVCATEHLILSLLQESDVQSILQKLKVSIEEVQDEAMKLSASSKPVHKVEDLKKKITTWGNRATMAQQQGNSELVAEALQNKVKYEMLLKDLEA